MEQLSFPLVGDAAPSKRRTRHRFGGPSGQYAEAVCRSCPVHRRYGPFCVRAGYCHQWSLDGEHWQDTEIACVPKAHRKASARRRRA